MEDVFSMGWLPWLGAVVALVVVLALVLWGWRKASTRGARVRRIAAARVRSGHVPLEIPTVPAVLNSKAPASDGTKPEVGIDEGVSVVVDEQPRLHLSYTDAQGKLTERIVQVEQLDLMRNVIVARGDFGGAVLTLPLDRIRRARNAQSGKAFALGTWIDAVRVARRRRELYGPGYADAADQAGW